MRKYGTPEPRPVEIEKEDPQGIDVTAAREQTERPTAEEIQEEGNE